MIKVKGLNYKKLLKDINLDINKGEFISLVGANGSGKTTLALLLSGLLGELPEEVNIDSKIAMVFENPDNQIIGTTAEDDIAFGLQNLGLDRDIISNRINEVLKLLNIEELKYREITSLSGGQKQKVAFASLIALDYKVYILDEVTSMLDPESKAMVIELIKKLNSEGKTIIQITHFMDELELTSRTIVMNNASIVFDGQTSKLLNDKKLMEENRLI